jgi:uncharacterized protein with HEPN domain
LGDLKTKHAVERNFSIIGEAVARIDKPFRDKYPSVDWREVKISGTSLSTIILELMIR